MIRAGPPLARQVPMRPAHPRDRRPVDPPRAGQASTVIPSDCPSGLSEDAHTPTRHLLADSGRPPERPPDDPRPPGAPTARRPPAAKRPDHPMTPAAKRPRSL